MIDLFKSMPKWLKWVVTLFLLACLLFDAWYLVIKKYAPQKNLDYRFIVDELQGVEDETKNIMNLVYYSNENGNGQEMLEIRINFLVDENSSETYSVGLQLLGTKDKPIQFKNSLVKEQDALNMFKHAYYYYGATTNNERYVYNSSNGLTFNGSQNAKEANSFLVNFKNSSNETKFYKMTFKNRNTLDLNSLEKEYEHSFLWKNTYTVQEYNIDYLVMGLFDRIKNIPNGTDQKVLFKFADDMFMYSERTNDNTYTDIETGTTEESHVRTSVENYFYVKLHKYADGVRTSSDSLFGVVANNYTYGEGNRLDYYNATQIIELHENDFEYVHQNLNNYKLKFKFETLEKLQRISQNSENFALKILLDKATLDLQNINPIGFISSENYNIYKVCIIDNGNEEVLAW